MDGGAGSAGAGAARPGMSEVVNLFDAPRAADEGDPLGYEVPYVRIGPLIGASALGMTVYELNEGNSICPYHWESPDEEWLIVLEGAPTLRDPDGEHELEEGDLVCFQAGPQASTTGKASSDPSLGAMSGDSPQTASLQGTSGDCPPTPALATASGDSPQTRLEGPVTRLEGEARFRSVARLPRNVLPAYAVFHVTARGVDRCVIYRDVEDYLLFVALFRRVVEREGLRVEAYCLMPNH